MTTPKPNLLIKALDTFVFALVLLWVLAFLGLAARAPLFHQPFQLSRLFLGKPGPSLRRLYPLRYGIGQVPSFILAAHHCLPSALNVRLLAFWALRKHTLLRLMNSASSFFLSLQPCG